MYFWPIRTHFNPRYARAIIKINLSRAENRFYMSVEKSSVICLISDSTKTIRFSALNFSPHTNLELAIYITVTYVCGLFGKIKEPKIKKYFFGQI